MAVFLAIHKLTNEQRTQRRADELSLPMFEPIEPFSLVDHSILKLHLPSVHRHSIYYLFRFHEMVGVVVVLDELVLPVIEVTIDGSATFVVHRPFSMLFAL